MGLLPNKIDPELLGLKTEDQITHILLFCEKYALESLPTQHIYIFPTFFRKKWLFGNGDNI